jgi:hypothetical protein
VLGLDGAATAGDKFNVFEDEKEAKQIASVLSMREQSVRTQRHITLDEIGRRIALGQFKELNVILKEMLTVPLKRYLIHLNCLLRKSKSIYTQRGWCNY